MSDLVDAAVVLEVVTTIRPYLDEGKMVDVSASLAEALDVKPDNLVKAVAVLNEEGYLLCYLQVDHPKIPNKKKPLRVLAPKGTVLSYVFRHTQDIIEITKDK